jgi:hypothetical protein
MAHETVVRVKKASFQAGNVPIKANKFGRNAKGELKGGYIVGMEGMDMELTVQPGWIIKTETYITDAGYQALRIFTEKA